MIHKIPFNESGCKILEMDLRVLLHWNGKLWDAEVRLKTDFKVEMGVQDV